MSSRRYPSGSEKRKRKKRTEEFIESQKGTMDRFLTNNSRTSRDEDQWAIVAVEEHPNINLEEQDPTPEANGLAILCIEKLLWDEIDIDTIINDFASRYVRRNF